MTQLLPPKKEVALALLERSNVDIYLDPRAEGVVVPPQFRKEPRLILKIGLNMAVQIPDLRLDDESMSCTLSFSRTPFYCVVPWPSVFAMVGEDGRGMVWPDDVPQELAVKTAEEERKSGATGAIAPDRPSQPSSERGRARRKAPALAEAPPSEASDEKEEKTKKRAGKKKKEEQPRPALVAVGAPRARGDEAAASQPTDRAASRSAGRTKPSADRPIAPPSAARAPAPSRPKRELPPYLRVVK